VCPGFLHWPPGTSSETQGQFQFHTTLPLFLVVILNPERSRMGKVPRIFGGTDANRNPRMRSRKAVAEDRDRRCRTLTGIFLCNVFVTFHTIEIYAGSEASMLAFLWRTFMENAAKISTNTVVVSRESICTARPKSRTSCCLQVPKQIIHDPDPSTYDQQLVFSTGGAPTFNSPDIDTVDIWPLRPIPTLTATVRNLSTQASANNTRVDLSWSAWGIGMPRTALGSTFVNLARAGYPGAEVTVSWPTPPALTATGLYGIFVSIVHPYDTDPYNNNGEQTMDGFQTSTGRSKTFVVPVCNPTGATQTIDLTAGPAQVAAWTTIVPSTLTLAPGAQQNVMVHIDVPSSVPASPPGTLISAGVDVLATIGGAYLGGVNIAILFDA
jgi:hypothetical protein